MESARLDRTLSALADPTRRRVVDLLKRRPRRAGELSSAVEMTPPAMSRHLRVLRESGLIEEQAGDGADARVRVYALRRQPFDELERWLDDVASHWEDQLSSFKAHVEAKKKGSLR